MAEDPTYSTQAAVLDLLLASYPGPTSLDELVLAIGDDIQTRDAVTELKAVGLAYGADELFWVTKAAWRFAELHGLVHLAQ